MMNEKIKQFFYEAKFEPDRLVDNIYYPYIPLQCAGEPWRHSITDDGVQKFAHLIIQECFNVVNGFALQQASEPENTLGENLFVSIKITDAAHKIKEHFGVE